MGNEKRKAGAYEITQSFRIGEKEFVFGRNPEDSTGHKYVCGTYECNELFERYTFTNGSDDFAEIAEAFGKGIQQEAHRFRNEFQKENVPKEAKLPVSPDKYREIRPSDDIENKVIVIRPDALRPEYRAAMYQMVLCVGGFGSHPNSRGSSCYCLNLHTNEQARFDRSQIIGIMKPDQIPDWARQTLQKLKKPKAKSELSQTR